jgi:rhodanese-related sulfurtransferase
MNSIFDTCKIRINGIPFACPTEVPGLLMKGARLVDIREDFEISLREFSVGDIIYMPFQKIMDNPFVLPENIPLILADSAGLKSKEAVVFLRANGFTEVASLAGGIVEWERDNLPVKNDKGQQLNGPCLCMLRPKTNT